MTDKPPLVSRPLFWSLIASTVGVSAALSLRIVVLDRPTDALFSNASVVRLAILQATLVLAWTLLLRRRGWSVRTLSARPSALDPLHGVGLGILFYSTYWIGFSFLAMVVPAFYHAATSLRLGGSLSWWAVALTATVNPIAEELLYLGFIANVVRNESLRLALSASVLARAIAHVYQGPVGVLSASLLGVVLGVYYLRSHRLLPAIVAHSILDAIALARFAGAA
jgi:membrane protease YdiL (CAAX protease family)